MMCFQASPSLGSGRAAVYWVVTANGALQWRIPLQDRHQVPIPLREADTPLFGDAFDGTIVFEQLSSVFEGQSGTLHTMQFVVLSSQIDKVPRGKAISRQVDRG